MSSIKQKMMAKIKKRASEIKRHKERTSRREVEAIVLDFLESVEKAKLNATHHSDFESALFHEGERLYASFKLIDPNVYVKVHWNDEENLDNWQDMNVDAVRIRWSDTYILDNPGEQDLYIDAAQLFLEGFLDEADAE